MSLQRNASAEIILEQLLLHFLRSYFLSESIAGLKWFSLSFQKVIVRYKKIGCNIDVLRQTACLVVNPIKVNSFAYLFNCTTVGRASD